MSYERTTARERKDAATKSVKYIHISSYFTTITDDYGVQHQVKSKGKTYYSPTKEN